MSLLDEKINLWAQRLRTIAQTGIGFNPPVYDVERYQEMLQLAAEMAATRGNLMQEDELTDALYNRWRGEVGSGVAGYVTPKVGCGGVVFNARGELLLIERPSH